MWFAHFPVGGSIERWVAHVDVRCNAATNMIAINTCIQYYKVLKQSINSFYLLNSLHGPPHSHMNVKQIIVYWLKEWTHFWALPNIHQFIPYISKHKYYEQTITLHNQINHFMPLIKSVQFATSDMLKVIINKWKLY